MHSSLKLNMRDYFKNKLSTSFIYSIVPFSTEIERVDNYVHNMMFERVTTTSKVIIIKDILIIAILSLLLFVSLSLDSRRIIEMIWSTTNWRTHRHYRMRLYKRLFLHSMIDDFLSLFLSKYYSDKYRKS